MDHDVYKVIELVGSSTSSVEDAIQLAINKAAETIYNIRWFEVLETRGRITDNRIAHYQVRLKIGFRVGDPDFAEDDFTPPGTDPLHEGP